MIFIQDVLFKFVLLIFWYDSSKSAMNKIKIAYNNSLRRLLALPKHNSVIFVNLNIPIIRRMIKKVCL